MWRWKKSSQRSCCLRRHRRQTSCHRRWTGRLSGQEHRRGGRQYTGSRTARRQGQGESARSRQHRGSGCRKRKRSCTRGCSGQFISLCAAMSNGQSLTTHGVTGVSAGGGTLVLTELRAGLELSAANGLAQGRCERVGVDGDSRVYALGSNKAREGRSGEDDGGVEHDYGEVWRWRSDRHVVVSKVFAKEQAGRARWQGCCSSVGASMLTWLFVEREWGINGKSAAECG